MKPIAALLAGALFAAAGCASAPKSDNVESPGSTGDPDDGGMELATGSDPGEDAEDDETADEVGTASEGGGAGGDVEAAKKATPQAATTDANLQGTLSQAEIAELVLKHNDLFNDCYSIGAGSSKEFNATVKVRATIGPSGKVTATEVVKSDAKNPKVDACVADAFKKIPFPAPDNGATSVVTFPMKFEGVEQIK